jgi:hypothetical protein
MQIYHLKVVDLLHFTHQHHQNLPYQNHSKIYIYNFKFINLLTSNSLMYTSDPVSISANPLSLLF